MSETSAACVDLSSLHTHWLQKLRTTISVHHLVLFLHGVFYIVSLAPIAACVLCVRIPRSVQVFTHVCLYLYCPLVFIILYDIIPALPPLIPLPLSLPRARVIFLGISALFLMFFL